MLFARFLGGSDPQCHLCGRREGGDEGVGCELGFGVGPGVLVKSWACVGSRSELWESATVSRRLPTRR